VRLENEVRLHFRVRLINWSRRVARDSEEYRVKGHHKQINITTIQRQRDSLDYSQPSGSSP
jgi:hypothetical protein